MANDLAEINEIENQSFGLEAFSVWQFIYLSKSPTCQFMVAAVGKKIGGYIILTTRKNSKTLRIYSLATSINFRGQGIGKMLLKYAINFAKQKGFTSISLEVSETNLPAIRLYEDACFASVGTKKDYYGLGKHAHAMRLKL